ncbi:MAG TPA: phosphate ABC transporter permease PstA [Candidatus Limnocylindrales bacterium]|nr:phosphate ABC transporter permease PstA [Candidatus Limnocylindrales bacterium]
MSINPELLGDERSFQRSLRLRTIRGNVWKRFFLLAVIVGVLALVALFATVINDAFGYVISTYKVEPAVLAPPDGDLKALTNEELAGILAEYTPNRLAVYIRDYIYTGNPSDFTTMTMAQALPNAVLPPGAENLTVRELPPEQATQILALNLDQARLILLVEENVVVETIYKTFTLTTSIFDRASIEAELAKAPAGAFMYFRSWLSLDFILSPPSSNAAATGIRVALLGSLWVTSFTILFAFPIGLGAAIYLEEYAGSGRFNAIIETNIRNLAGVPSIIYGILGLAVFVRLLADFTGGRSILSAALTMSLLILPVIIINAQEAIRAVPSSLREASYGVGSTQWQTVRRVVLPSALPGILTGTILALSRAIGETAPLLLVGASTFIVSDPTGLLSKFTVLPIQIFNYTARPQQPFRDAAAAAIIVLLVLLLLFNATAIILRQRARRRLSA